MKKLKFGYIFVAMIIAIGMFLFSNSLLFRRSVVYADEDLDIEINTSGYTITAYDINIEVAENKVMEVTETISATFTGYNKHGIIRSIPYIGKFAREDGSSDVYRALLTIKKVEFVYKGKTFTDYSLSTDMNGTSSNYKIKIGDEDLTVKGDVQYIISYVYNMGIDPLEDADEFYYNLIGTEWDTSIENVTFSITFPKDISTRTDLGFTSGQKGSTFTGAVTYDISTDNLTITGTYDQKLPAYHGLTMRMVLPEDYFSGESDNLKDDLPYKIVIPLLIGILMLIIAMWVKMKKNRHFVAPVTFYPPQDMNSLDVSREYYGFCKSQAVTSLIVYLASKGYIKIKDDINEYGKKSFAIEFVKDYNGSDSNEKKVFDKIFGFDAPHRINENGDIILEDYEELVDGKIVIKKDAKIVATEKDLKNNFKNFMLKTQLNSTANREKYIEHSNMVFNISAALILTALMAISFAIITRWYYSIMSVFLTVIFALFPLLLFSVISLSSFVSIKATPFLVVFSIFWLSPVAIVMGSIIPVLAAVNPGFIVLIALTIIVGVVIYGLIMTKAKRKESDIKIYGEVVGFRNFLLKAEKPKLEALVNDDPAYFYNILPYTYALGISSKWIKKFESIKMDVPDWIESSNFDALSFMALTHSIERMNNIVTTASTFGEGFGSGGSSGGGFSGGGGGGGGGSSW